MGFIPCKAEPDIWMQQDGKVYEYIGIYVDDVAATAKDPKAITDLLQDKYQFKLKGTGPIQSTFTLAAISPVMMMGQCACP